MKKIPLYHTYLLIFFTITNFAFTALGEAKARSHIVYCEEDANILPANSDGYVEATVTSLSEDFVLGLSASSQEVQGIQKILKITDYAFYQKNNSLRLYHQGKYIGSFGNVAIGSKLRIEREGELMLFYKDGIAIHTVDTNPNIDLYLKINDPSRIDEVSIYFIPQLKVDGTISGNQINLSVEGGIAPYTYSWSHGATSPSISNLYTGEYEVTVTDSREKDVIKSFSISSELIWAIETSMENVSANIIKRGQNGGFKVLLGEDEFRAGMYIGFVNKQEISGPSSILHGMAIFSDDIYVIENGILTTRIASAQNGLWVSLEKDYSTIKYVIGTTVAYTTFTKPNEALYIKLYGDWGTSSPNILPNFLTATVATGDPSDRNDGLAANWVRTNVFDENGIKTAATKVFFNNLGQEVQIQTKNYATNVITGREFVYDAQGRNVLSSLAAPTGESSDNLAYQSDFLTNGSNNRYSYLDFDTDATLNNPNTVRNTNNAAGKSTVGKYYSNSNIDEAYIPTTSYPYSRVEYHLDGGLKRVGRVGEHYRMGSGNEVRTFQLMSGGELAYLYGFHRSFEVEVDENDPLNPIPKTIDQNVEAYKTVTIGSDGIEQISFTNGAGQILATCVSGYPEPSSCPLQTASHTLDYYGSRTTKIHLPHIAGQSKQIRAIYPQAYVFNNPGENQSVKDYITFTITDLNTNEMLNENIDYSISLGSSQLILTFIGNHANQNGFYKIAYDYTSLYDGEYQKFFAPGHKPPLVLEYQLDYSNWTLNYYDNKGLIRKVIPPKGINCIIQDLSGFGTTYYHSAKDLYVIDGNGNYTYQINNLGIKSISAVPPSSQAGVQISGTLKSIVKPGIIPDYNGGNTGDEWWNPNVPIEPISVDIPVEPSVETPTGGGKLESMSTSEFDDLYQPISATAIQEADASAHSSNASQRATDEIIDGIAQCFNGVLDFGEVSIDCGGICPDCECSTAPSFLASFQFAIHTKGSNNTLESGIIYRTLGVTCNGYLADITPENEPTEFFASLQPNVVQNHSNISFELFNVKVKTESDVDFVAFNANNNIHRLVRYIYLKFDGQKEVFLRDPVPHTMSQTYHYDYFGDVLAYDDPDRGLTEYIYDNAGKLRFSQNTEQRENDDFSYINYDQAHRIIETGEFSENANVNPDREGYYYDFPAHYYNPSQAENTEGKSLLYVKNLLGLQTVDGGKDQSYFFYDQDLAKGDFALMDFPASISAAYYSTFVAGALAKSQSADCTTWYKYDYRGRLVATVQHQEDTGFKTMDYTYDFFDRRTNAIYQKNNFSEKFEHQYTYNQNGELIHIESIKYRAPNLSHATYHYNKIGQLQRMELGENLQGIDYTYTIDGALKAINHPIMNDPSNPTKDPGKDGSTGAHVDFAPDVFGLSLDYHAADYVRSGTFFNYGHDVGAANDYVDGRIKSVRWNYFNDIDGSLPDASRGKTWAYYHTYDWKQQLTSATFGEYTPNTNGDTNNNSGSGNYTNPVFGNFAGGTSYTVDNISYDLNGNILNLKRRQKEGSNLQANLQGPDTGDPSLIDNLTYHYPNNSNQLNRVTDASNFYNASIGDVQSQVINNYVYTNNGQIKEDKEKDVIYLYNSFGKLAGIDKISNGLPLMRFAYNEYGNRIRKTTYQSDGTPEKTTIYVREANGSLMAIYEKDHTATNNTFDLNEIMLDGGQLGIYYNNSNLYSYQLTDHLGNVRVTIDRNKNGSQAKILSYSDYYPYGMNLPERNSAASPQYRLGYQGQELDEKIGLYAFQLRNYDPRLGKWLSPDPYDQHWSPYLAMSNNPISFVDPDGGWDFGITYYVDGMRASSWEGRSFLSSGEFERIDYQGSGGMWWNGYAFHVSKGNIYNIRGYNPFQDNETFIRTNPRLAPYEEVTIANLGDPISGFNGASRGDCCPNNNEFESSSTESNLPEGILSYLDVVPIGNKILDDRITISPVVNPVISSEFGIRIHPISGKQKGHKGIDIVQENRRKTAGTDVVAPLNGKIISIKSRRDGNGAGNRISIEASKDGKVHNFFHLQDSNFATSLKKGSEIDRGDKLGQIGTTGGSTGPHLHYEVRVKRGGKALNPRNENSGLKSAPTVRQMRAKRRKAQVIPRTTPTGFFNPIGTFNIENIN